MDGEGDRLNVSLNMVKMLDGISLETNTGVGSSPPGRPVGVFDQQSPEAAPPAVEQLQTSRPAPEEMPPIEDEEGIKGYCVRCRQGGIPLTGVQKVEVKGKPAYKGFCSNCGSPVVKFRSRD